MSDTYHVYRANSAGSVAWGLSRVKNQFAPAVNDKAKFGMGSVSVEALGWTYTDGWESPSPFGIYHLNYIDPLPPAGAVWHHVVAGWDGDSIFLQLDNGARVTAPCDGVPSTPNGMLVVRGFQVSGAAINPLEAFHDELAIWSGRALSEADVAADWNGGDGQNFAGTNKGGLLAYWTFDEFASVDEFEDAQAGYRLVWNNVITPEAGHENSRIITAGKLGQAVRISHLRADPLFPNGDNAAGRFENNSNDFDFCG